MERTDCSVEMETVVVGVEVGTVAFVVAAAA